MGRAETDILSSLDLLVRPVLPRFFVVGDRAAIEAGIRELGFGEIELLDADGLPLAGEPSAEEIDRRPHFELI